MTTPIQPTPIITPEVAKGLRLSSEPSLRHIGYWRCTEDRSDGYQHQSLRSSERDLAEFRKTGRPPYYNGQTIDEAYLMKQVQDSHRSVVLAAMLPWPGDHVDPSMPDEERNRIAKAIFDHHADGISTRYASSSWDRLGWPKDAARPWECLMFTGIGSGEVVHDGWVWPEGLIRYVQNYGLVLPEEFLAAVGA